MWCSLRCYHFINVARTWISHKLCACSYCTYRWCAWWCWPRFILWTVPYMFMDWMKFEPQLFSFHVILSCRKIYSSLQCKMSTGFQLYENSSIWPNSDVSLSVSSSHSSWGPYPSACVCFPSEVTLGLQETELKLRWDKTFCDLYSFPSPARHTLCPDCRYLL